MELLIGAVVSLIIQAIKRFNLSKNEVIVIVFIASVVAAVVYSIMIDQITPEILATIAKVWAVAIAFYEVVIKLFVNKIFSQVTGKSK